jgi:transitional endoplasmic reticulum ATPase
LDPASLRRFLVKLRFSWLTTAQARIAFRQFFGVGPPPELDGLRTLTSADFALVRRRVSLTGQEGDQGILLRLLAAETAGRRDSCLQIGFRAWG